MRFRQVVCSIAVALLGFVASQASLGQNAASRQHHYRLIDLGTFGGPHSQVNSGSIVINKHGVVAGGVSGGRCPWATTNPSDMLCFRVLNATRIIGFREAPDMFVRSESGRRKKAKAILTIRLFAALTVVFTFAAQVQQVPVGRTQTKSILLRRSQMQIAASGSISFLPLLTYIAAGGATTYVAVGDLSPTSG